MGHFRGKFSASLSSSGRKIQPSEQLVRMTIARGQCSSPRGLYLSGLGQLCDKCFTPQLVRPFTPNSTRTQILLEALPWWRVHIWTLSCVFKIPSQFRLIVHVSTTSLDIPIRRVLRAGKKNAVSQPRTLLHLQLSFFIGFFLSLQVGLPYSSPRKKVQPKSLSTSLTYFPTVFLFVRRHYKRKKGWKEGREEGREGGRYGIYYSHFFKIYLLGKLLQCSTKLSLKNQP